MDERVQQRKIRHRVAVLRHAAEVTGNVASTCRYFGISRPTFYCWLNRYEELGEEGLRDGSSRPKHCPHETNADVVGKIMYLRQHYHFGPYKISMYLKRYHDIDVSKSGVWRILHRLELGRLPASQRHKAYDRRWKRYEKPLPGHRVQIDVKFIEPIAGQRAKRFYQYTAIDDCTRIRVLRIYPKNNQQSAIQFLDYVLEKLPFQVEVIQTDNGSEFQAGFHWHVLDRGIHHTYSSPAHHAERQSRAITPHRRRGVLPNARRHRHRRHRPVQRQAPRVGRLLQLPPTTRRPRWTNPLRTATTEDNQRPQPRNTPTSVAHSVFRVTIGACRDNRATMIIGLRWSQQVRVPKGADRKVADPPGQIETMRMPTAVCGSWVRRGLGRRARRAAVLPVRHLLRSCAGECRRGRSLRRAEPPGDEAILFRSPAPVGIAACTALHTARARVGRGRRDHHRARPRPTLSRDRGSTAGTSNIPRTGQLTGSFRIQALINQDEILPPWRLHDEREMFVGAAGDLLGHQPHRMPHSIISPPRAHSALEERGCAVGMTTMRFGGDWLQLRARPCGVARHQHWHRDSRLHHRCARPQRPRIYRRPSVSPPSCPGATTTPPDSPDAEEPDSAR